METYVTVYVMTQHSKNKYINVSSLSSLADFGISRASVAIGVFDGVHIGHRHLLTELFKMTEQNRSEPVALTFFPHPRTILRPDSPPSLLIPPFKKIELLHLYGIKAVITIPFTKEFSMFSPEAFIKSSLMTKEVELAGICVGRNWRFGAGGTGDRKSSTNSRRRSISASRLSMKYHLTDTRSVVQIYEGPYPPGSWRMPRRC